jgi:cyclic-di-GMP-binding protein
MPSFDVMLEPDFVELRNAVAQTEKEIGARFDFKGSSAKVELTSEKGSTGRDLMIHADSDFQIGQVKDILLAKLAKRGVDVRYLDQSAKIEAIGGDKVRQPVKVKVGIGSDLGRRLQTLVKQSKLKVTAAIQGDTVRITGAKRDDLQAVIALLKREITDEPLKFGNLRD